MGNNQFQPVVDGQIDPNAIFTITANGSQLNINSSLGQSVATKVNALNPRFVACSGNELVNTLFTNADGSVSVIPMPTPIAPVKAPGEQPFFAINANSDEEAGIVWTMNTSSIAGVWDDSELNDH